MKAKRKKNLNKEEYVESDGFMIGTGTLVLLSMLLGLVGAIFMILSQNLLAIYLVGLITGVIIVFLLNHVGVE